MSAAKSLTALELEQVLAYIDPKTLSTCTQEIAAEIFYTADPFTAQARTHVKSALQRTTTTA